MMRGTLGSVLSRWLLSFAYGAPVCLLGTADPGLAQTIDETGHPDSMLVYASQLETHPELNARADQILVFDLQSDRNQGRFLLKAGVHRFCLEGGAGYFTGIVLETDRGAVWPMIPDGKGCVKATLPTGVMTVVLRRGDGARPEAAVTATVRVDPALSAGAESTPLLDTKNNPVGGYWLLQDINQNARGTFQYVVTLPHMYLQMQDYTNALSPTTLFRFPQADGSYTSATLPQPETEWKSCVVDGNYEVAIHTRGAPPVPTCGGSGYGSPPPIQIQDLGKYDFNFMIRGEGNFSYGLRSVFIDSAYYLYGNYLTPDTFQVLFRYFEDGTQIGDLRPGEVAVYDQCNFKGRAAVFVPSLGPGQVSPPYDLRKLTSDFWPLNGNLKSFRVSKGTGLYWGTDLDHLQGAVIQDNACAPQSAENSLYVEPVSNVITIASSAIFEKSCVNCDFSNLRLINYSSPINFQGWTLTGADFTGDLLNNFDFTGATLTNAKFPGATVKYARFLNVSATPGSIDLAGAFVFKDVFTGSTLSSFNFAGAQICGTSLSGADANHVLDLTTAPFTNATIQISRDCSTDISGNPVNLSYTNLALSSNSGPNWGSTNLTGATFTNVSGVTLSTQQTPLLLGQATLAGISLQGAILDYTQGLAGKDLTGVQLSGATLRSTDLHGARLYSANLQNSNLDGANLNGAYLTQQPLHASAGAQLQGAFLRNVNLSQAQLSGANFTNANFFGTLDTEQTGCAIGSSGFTSGCATAAGATMNNTSFNNAYLYGVDFSNSTAQGVNFGNAYLAGSNFFGTRLTASSTGNDTGFTGAFLQGANLAGTSLPPSTSFLGAFFDFSPQGNTLTFPLDGTHTTFAGYWSTPGNPVCVAMIYAQAATLPPTTRATVCPDGQSLRNGCGRAAGRHWNSLENLLPNHTYTAPATYYPASATSACTADNLWNYGPGETSRPNSQTRTSTHPDRPPREAR